MSLRLKIGPAVVAVVADFPIHDRSYWRYGPFAYSGTEPPTATIRVQTDPPPPRGDAARVGEFVRHWKVYAQGESLRLEILEQTELRPKQVACINRTFDQVDLHVMSWADFPEASGWEMNELEPLLQWYLTARLALRAEGVILHGSAVCVEGGGLVFVGPSGAGKTTLAGWCRDEAGATVLNDERIVMWRDRNGWQVAGTPWRGELSEVSGGGVPLRQIFFLRQAGAHRFVRRPPAQCLTELIPQCFLPIWSRKGMECLLATAAGLAAEIPSGELQFAKDRSIVSYLQRLVGELPEPVEAA